MLRSLPRSRHWRSGAIVLIAIHLVIAVIQRTSGAADLAGFLETWRKRGNQIESFAVTWKAHLAHPSPRGHDVVFETSGEVIWDQSGRIRVDMDTIDTGRRTSSVREPSMTRRIDVNDGISRTKFHAKTEGGFPAAFILNGTTADTGRRVHILPVALALRPLDEALGGFSQDEVSLDGAEEINGTQCVVLGTRYGTLWVTDDLDYLPVRYVEFRQGGLTPIYEVDITYAKEESGLNMPAGWTILFFEGDGTTAYQSISATVTEFNINQPTSKESFEVELPPGTWVQNLITNESFIIREGKPNRTVRPGEYNRKNYEQLLNSDPVGLKDLHSRSRRRSLLIWGNLALAATFGLALIARKGATTLRLIKLTLLWSGLPTGPLARPKVSRKLVETFGPSHVSRSGDPDTTTWREAFITPHM